MHYIKKTDQLEVYMETQKRRLYVGDLFHDVDNARYIFSYDEHYLRSKSAMAVGPELPATRRQFISEDDQLFPTFLDRIPDKRNAAYEDYCHQQGINVDEQNKIILLTTIGHRGPSCFVYEAIYTPEGEVACDLKQFRKKLQLTQWDFAMLFDFPVLTIQRVESYKTRDKNILRLISAFMSEPQLALEQMRLTGKRVHRNVRTRVYEYFQSYHRK